MVKDQQALLSLKKTAKVAKKEGIIFQDLAEPLLDGQIDIENSWPNLNGTHCLIGTSLASITFIYCIWSFFKIRTLTTTILILERTINSHSASISSFIFKPEATTTSSIISHIFEREFNMNHILLIIIGILIIFVGLISFKRRNSKYNFTYLMMEITTGTSCYQVPLIKMPLCPSYWETDMPPQ